MLEACQGAKCFEHGKERGGWGGVGFQGSGGRLWGRVRSQVQQQQQQYCFVSEHDHSASQQQYSRNLLFRQ